MTVSTGAFVIEIEDQTVGIVVPDENDAFRFFASVHAFFDLEQQRFATPRAAQKAARALRETQRRNRTLPLYDVA
jgi:hypothetical protein